MPSTKSHELAGPYDENISPETLPNPGEVFTRLGEKHILPKKLQRLYDVYANPQTHKQVKASIELMMERVAYRASDILCLPPESAKFLLPELITDQKMRVALLGIFDLLKEFKQTVEANPLNSNFPISGDSIDQILERFSGYIWGVEGHFTPEEKAEFKRKFRVLSDAVPNLRDTEKRHADPNIERVIKLRKYLTVTTLHPSLLSLLKNKTRRTLDPEDRSDLLAFFNQQYAEKFFPHQDKRSPSEDLFSAEQLDTTFLQEWEYPLSYEEYLQWLHAAIRKIVRVYTSKPEDTVRIGEYAIRSLGVHAQPLTNPFTGGRVMGVSPVLDAQQKVIGEQEHLFINPEEGPVHEKLAQAGDLGVYKQGERTPLFVIPTAWKLLMDEHLLQSPESIWSLSPRKILPALRDNPELITFLQLRDELPNS